VVLFNTAARRVIQFQQVLWNESVRLRVEQDRGFFCGTALQNIIDEIVALVARTKDKLRRK
jgi:hypothetical protein